jgi:predicted nucleic-acid-binding protein
MISLDTNVIARFYVDDPSDSEAIRQRPLARQVFEDSPALFVPMTVVLELEWVLRAFYEFSSAQFARVVRHLAGLPHVTLERSTEVMSALQDHLLGLDFTDALHLRCSAHCTRMVTFDDKKFARRAAKLQLSPALQVPS